jgi:hypothetical protein
MRMTAGVVFCLLLIGAAAPSIAAVPAKPSAITASLERQRVAAAVAGRAGDGKALAKVREKLAVLKGSKLRLAAALCDRIEPDEHSAAADIAFSIVTALIVLS